MCVYVYVYIYVCAHMHKHTETILVICGFCICDVTDSLKCTWTLKTSVCSAFVVIHRHVLSDKKCGSRPRLRSDKARLCLLVSAPIL